MKGPQGPCWCRGVGRRGTWMVFPVQEDGSTVEGKLFVNPKTWKVKPAKGGGVDGMKCDTTVVAEPLRTIREPRCRSRQRPRRRRAAAS